jgi:3D (Asp-Asp-Asp) domain-containing protein
MNRHIIIVAVLISIIVFPVHVAHAVPFGGLIIGRIECTCTGNYLIIVNTSNGQKNLLVMPPLSRLFQYYLFNIGQFALGTYTPGPKCLIQNGQKCDEVPTDGVIDSMPGAGSSGPLTPTAKVNSPFGDILKNVVSSLGGLLGSNSNNRNNNTLNPGQENSVPGQNAGQQLLRVGVKNYFIPSEREFSGTSTAPILDRNGTLIAEANRIFATSNENGTLFNEGVGILRDGTVLAYDQTINGSKRYNVVTSGVGVGKTGIPLSPFRSIAVDTSVISLGSLVEIQRTRGMTLPDGTKHNGIWRADDIVDENATEDISLFIGVSANRTFLSNAGIRNQDQMSVTLFEQ